MKQRTTVLSVLALLLAGSAQAQVKVKAYGFLHAAYHHAFNRPIGVDRPPLQAVSESNTTPPNHNTSVFSARGTRLGLKVEGGRGPVGTDISGVLEVDFAGLRQAGTANADVLQFAPRLRLAYIAFKRLDHGVVFGQDWIPFSPLSPISVVAFPTNIFHSAGNLFMRVPQLRWDANWITGDTRLTTKLALLRNFTADNAGRVSGTATNATAADNVGSGESSGGPATQAQVEFSPSLFGRSFVVGGSTHYGRRKFTSLVTPPAGTVTKYMEDLLYAAHVKLPVLTKLELQGEFYYGRGDANFTGGIGSTLFNDLGDPRQPLGRGGWLQAIARPIPGWRVSGGYGFARLNTTGLAAATLYRNEKWATELMWDVSTDLSLGLLLARVHSDFVSIANGAQSLAGVTHYFGTAAQYKF